MKSAEIRDRFLTYFEGKGHTRVDSSSLVPGNDPTLLFTNAGMVQFKEAFLGQEKRAYTRATTSQRCVRAGGKHNDLENVGYTARHHTFFEMLGNFSFGDYFKRDAIAFAWEFLTVELQLPKDKLWVTVHKDDQEAEDIWLKEVGVSADRFSHMGDKDNFWTMGDTGPCGPCSEIFYDHGADVPGGPPGSPDDDLDRYIEIWNLVFMQFDQQADGSRVPLPKPSVDTGMGLERLSAVLQHVHSNYEIDLFQGLIKAAATLTGSKDHNDYSLRVIADHIRSAAFLISDGVVPSNEGRGYVLRRIIRRAIRHGNKLGSQGPFFHQLVDELVVQMGGAYPELVSRKAMLKKVLRLEEEQFAKTLDKGLAILNDEIALLSDTVIPGEVAFKLYDTYGFPVDLTADIARERSLTVDEAGFESAMQKQRKRSQESSAFTMKMDHVFDLGVSTIFVGYGQTAATSVITALLTDAPVTALTEGMQGVLVLDNTPFYAESGGQVGDTGMIRCGHNQFAVKDTIKNGDNHFHMGVVVSGEFAVGHAVSCEADRVQRQDTARHHSATHLLHAALRNVLGSHVQQKGSLVDATKLRFDFTHIEAITPELLQHVEDMVNAQVLDNSPVTTDVMSLDAAKEKGAMALFGEKYSADVRVLSMGNDGFSVELCGGTHVQRTGDIGIIKILAESGIAAGVRRIEAVAGQRAYEHVRSTESIVSAVQKHLKATASGVVGKVEDLLASHKVLEKELEQLKQKLASAKSGDLVSQAKKIGESAYLAVAVDSVDAKGLRDMADQLKQKLGSSVVMVVSENDGKVHMVVGVSKDLIVRHKAGALVGTFAAHVGGKGGGKPDMAMAGGTDPSGIPAAIAAFYAFADTQATN